MEKQRYKVSIQVKDDDFSFVEDEVFVGNITEKQRDLINESLVKCGLSADENEQEQDDD